MAISIENRQFFPSVYVTLPLKGLGIGAGSEETRMAGLPGGRKSFKIGLAVLIQYHRVTDPNPSQPATSPASHSKQAQLMLTTGSTHLAVSRGQQTWYHFGSIATFR